MDDEKLKIISDEISKEIKNSKQKLNAQNNSTLLVNRSKKVHLSKSNKLVRNIISDNSDNQNIKNQDQSKKYLPLKKLEFHPPISVLYNRIISKKNFYSLNKKLKPLNANNSCPQLVKKYKKNILFNNIKHYSPRKGMNKTTDNMSKTLNNKKFNVTQVKFDLNANSTYRSNNQDLRDTHYNNFSFYLNKNNNININKKFDQIETNPLKMFVSDFCKYGNKDNNQDNNNNQNIFVEKRPLNYLWHYRSQLFDKKDYKYKNKKNSDESQKEIDTRPEDIEILYETIDFCGHKSCVATKLVNNKSVNNIHAQLVGVNEQSNEDDYHYLMKHPFLSSSFKNLKQNKANWYIDNNVNEEFTKFNPLLDEDLIDKIHNLIINPNTLQVRNEKLLNIYKNFIKGPQKTKYNKKYVFEKNIEQEKMVKFKKLMKQLDETLQQAKEVNQKCESIVEDNKRELNC